MRATNDRAWIIPWWLLQMPHHLSYRATFSLQAIICFVTLFALHSTFGLEDKPAEQTAAKRPPVEFVTGLRIDWSDRHIEIDAKVVFREGPLELFACIAQTREHESIVIVKPRPLHVFQALGLIGLDFGSPVTYDEKTEKWNSASGDRLSIEVKYARAGVERTEPIERWMLDAKTNKSPDPIEWVFAGSRYFDKKKFGADFEGTVICVVDFETAIIAPRDLHSSSNEQLWLVANTEEIPPLGTPCTIIIRPRSDLKELSIVIMEDGTLRRNDTVIKPVDVVQLRKTAGKTEKDVKVILRHAPSLSDEQIKTAVESLKSAGVPADSISTEKIKPEPPTEKPPPKELDNFP